MCGLLVVVLALSVSILGSLIRPDSTPMANQMNLQLSTKAPGFKVQLLSIRKNTSQPKTGLWGRMFFGGQESDYLLVPIDRYYFDGKDIVVVEYSGVPNFKGIVQRYTLPDVLYPLRFESKVSRDLKNRCSFYTADGTLQTESIAAMQQKILNKNLRTKTFWLGTDRFGRDLLSRLMSGTLISMAIGLISVLISIVLGLILGSIAGYYRGWIDQAIMWLIQVVWSIPTLLLVIAITLSLGKGFWQIFIAVGFTMWVEIARVVRGQVMSLREKEFIEAGKSLGFSHFRIIFRHILPNVMGVVSILAASNFANAILMEAGLSFLGIGVQAPMTSWGSMIKDHYGYIVVDAAYLAILPGLAIFLLVLAFTLVGNGLRDALAEKDSVKVSF